MNTIIGIILMVITFIGCGSYVLYLNYNDNIKWKEFSANTNCKRVDIVMNGNQDIGYNCKDVFYFKDTYIKSINELKQA